MVSSRVIKLSILNLLLLTLFSCQKADLVAVVKQQCPNGVKDKSPLIIGTNDWVQYQLTDNEMQDINEQTVAQIKIPAMLAACTAFLINEDTLMTNNHCISTASRAINVRALFRNTDGTRSAYVCDKFITTNLQYDFTLIKCENSPGQKYGWVGLAKERVETGNLIYIVQENCDYIGNPRCTIDKYVAFGEVLGSLVRKIYHDADTLAGSSGSPIFSSDTHQVVALHNAGSPATSTTPARNAGVPMYQIRNVIEATSNVIIHEFGTANSLPVVDPTPTETPTPTPSETPTPEIIPYPTATPGPDGTPIPTPTQTPNPIQTPTNSNTIQPDGTITNGEYDPCKV